MARQKQAVDHGTGEPIEKTSVTKELATLGGELRIKLFQSGETKSLVGASEAYLWAIKIALGFLDNGKKL